MKVKNFIYILCIAIITVAFGLNIYIAASNYGMNSPLSSLFAQSTSNGNSGSNGSNGNTNGSGGNSSSTDSITAGKRMIPNMHMDISSTNSSYTSKKEITSKTGKFFNIEIENSFKKEETIPVVITTWECQTKQEEMGVTKISSSVFGRILKQGKSSLLNSRTDIGIIQINLAHFFKQSLERQ